MMEALSIRTHWTGSLDGRNLRYYLHTANRTRRLAATVKSSAGTPEAYLAWLSPEESIRRYEASRASPTCDPCRRGRV